MIVPDFPPFAAHPLIRGGHAQTIAGTYFPSRQPPYSAVRRQVSLPDGDQLCLHDDCPDGWTEGQRVAVMVHGLGGCHGSPYMVRISAALAERGVRVFRLDLRGWGAGAKLAKLPFHAARTGDIAVAIEHVQALAPNSHISLLGFSLGAGIILKLLGERGRDDIDDSDGPVDSVLAVAPPVDLMSCCQGLSRGFSKVYDRKYAAYLWRHLRERASVVPAFETALREKPPRSIYDFDQRFTAPLGGFASVEEYYNTASSGPLLGHVRTPTLIIVDTRDPIVPGSLFHSDTVNLSPSIQLRITTGGGHLGYLARNGNDPTRRWLDWRCVDWVLAQG